MIDKVVSADGVLRVGIIRTSSVGDVVLATSCLDLLKKLSIPTEIWWLGKQPTLGLLMRSFPELHAIEISSKQSVEEVVAKLNGVRILVDLQVNLRSMLIAKAFKRKYSGSVFTCNKMQLHRNRLVLESRFYGRNRALPPRALKPIKLQHRMMSDTLFYSLRKLLPEQALGRIEEYQPAPQLSTAGLVDPDIDIQFLPSKRWLGTVVGASYETKRAPVSVFVDILGDLSECVKARGQDLPGLAFLGDANDQKFSEEVSRQLPDFTSIDLCGRTTLEQVGYALSKCYTVLGNDTGLLHIAESLAIPVVALFGPTVEGFGFAPRGPASRVFSVPLGCRPCSKHGKAICRYGDQRCFRDIPHHDVASYLLKLLSKTGG